MKPWFILWLLALVSGSVEVLAQKMEFFDVIKLGDHVNSGAEEVLPLMSPSGESLFFCRAFHESNMGGKNAGMDIWRSARNEQGTWESTNDLPYWNSKENNALIGIRHDGETVYLLNSYSSSKGIAFSKRKGDGWTRPETISIPGIKRGEYIGFYMNPSYDILLISMNSKNTYGQEDIYVSLKDEAGEWGNPFNLGSTINTEGFEISPFLSADGRKLYFTSNGHRGYGDADIFVSERLYESWTVWSQPKNLGPRINSEKFDAYFSEYDSICYFVSNKHSDNSDIYRARIIKETRTADQDSVQRIVADAERLLASIELRNRSEVASGFVSFEPNDQDISSRSMNSVNKVIERAKEFGDVEILLVGYSDEFTDSSLNHDLSEARMNSIKDLLVNNGFSADKIVFDVTSSAKDVSKRRSGVEIRVIK